MSRGRSSGQGESTDRSSDAAFLLFFRSLPVATLQRESSYWTFRYTPEFKQQHRVKPLVLFPDVNKVYKSAELWPFFSVRIPSIARPEIEKSVRREKLDYSDTVAMLCRFGRHSITDPFELRPHSTDKHMYAAF